MSKIKAVVQAGWDDAPWLNEQEMTELLEATPPHLREARRRGIPTVGSGLVYPIHLESVLYDDMPIPAYWPRMYALDVGWHNTACLWMAKNPDTGIRYIYSEYKEGEQRPEVHTIAIKALGTWIPGVIDPASQGRSATDGKALIDLYRRSGLKIIPANNEVQAGVAKVYELFTTGQLKIAKSCKKTHAELLSYAYDDKGKIMKKNDHLCDALRYNVMNEHIAIVKPRPFDSEGGAGARRYF